MAGPFSPPFNFQFQTGLTSQATPADIVNLALVRIGYPLRIGHLYDGSAAAKQALTVYAQTRDAQLRELEPGFAQRDFPLVLLKTAPQGGYVPPRAWNPATDPPVPWTFEYQYPADCLKVRALKTPPVFVPNPLPGPKLYRLANDNLPIPPATTPPGQVILTNLANAVLTYVGRTTDPNTWEPIFIESLVAALARRLTVALADPRLLEAEAKDEQTESVLTEMKQG